MLVPFSRRILFNPFALDWTWRPALIIVQGFSFNVRADFVPEKKLSRTTDDSYAGIRNNQVCKTDDQHFSSLEATPEPCGILFQAGVGKNTFISDRGSAESCCCL